MLVSQCRKSLSLQHAAFLRTLRATQRIPLTTVNASDRSRRLFGTQQDARPATQQKTFVAGRSLATSVDEYQPTTDSAYGALNNPILTAYQATPNHPRSYELRTFEPSAAIIPKLDLRMHPRSRTNIGGVPGDVEEMLPMFDACIQVGKIERAEMVLRRLVALETLPTENKVFLCNRLLRASLEQAKLHLDTEIADAMHGWYTMLISRPRLPQTAETVACMLKASLISESDPKRLKRLISQYMKIAPGEAGLKVLAMDEILDDRDVALITEIHPTYDFNEDASTVGEINSIEPDSPSTTTEPDVSKERASAFPEVLATPQKGVGLKSVKSTLSLFDEIPQNCDISTLPLRERREIQSRLESDCIEAAIERWREENESLRKMGLNTSVAHQSLNSRLYDWQLALEARLTEELSLVDAAEAAPRKSPLEYDRCLYGPFLRLSTPSRLAAVTIIGSLNSLAITGISTGAPLSTVLGSIARGAEEDIRSQVSSQKAKLKAKPKAKRKRAVLRPKGDLASDADAPDFLDDLPRDAAIMDASWPPTVRAKVGAALLSALIDTAKIKVVKEHPVTKTLVSQYQPAFSHATQIKKGRKIGVLLVNKELVSILKREPRADYLAKHLPMVVEPEPWSSFEQGGFLQSKSLFVRVKQGDKDQRLYAEAAIARGDMDQVFKGLDVLGKTAWRVNTPVLEVMLEAWNSGLKIANFPSLDCDVAIPPEPQASDDPQERKAWLKAVKAAENEKGGLHSQRCFINFQLEIARAYRNQTFYFPHNIDFRGRAYPLPTYLNHMGADHVRGVLRFAKGKELGEKGLEWVKVQLANVYGYDKASLRDRASFAMEHLADIYDSAEKPLTGNRWWLNAEDPWQCLAACFELKAALDSPDPTKYVSHLPVHQDGTCNGLQHYAALGGDSWGARQVNLEPGDKPSDVYSAVADIVKQDVARDAESGDRFAVALNGKITRKVVKQTVMTNVYGVTFSGARKQVCKQLDALYPDLPKETGASNLSVAFYVTKLVFKALASMFRGAHDIQYWLGEIGGRICRALSAEQLERFMAEGGEKAVPKSSSSSSSEEKTTTDDILGQFRTSIVWTTPLRLPVAQPYRKSGTRIIKTSLQDLSLTVPERSDPVHRRKQLQAFPPNFIHSLDATHMLLSALECNEIGLDFAAVHDSFWTHAADIDSMNRVLRDAFVRIHEEDVIGRLAAEFEARYRGSIYAAKVKCGSPVDKKITALRKVTKKTLKMELMEECKRQAMLRSGDPEQVSQAKAMVTPASIFEEMAAVEALAEPEDMDAFGLGDMPDDADTVSGNAIIDEEDAASFTDGVGEEDADVSESSAGFSNPAKAPKAVPRTHQIWLPLTFPDVPKKGDFDVRRLKDSKYFFS